MNADEAMFLSMFLSIFLSIFFGNPLSSTFDLQKCFVDLYNKKTRTWLNILFQMDVELLVCLLVLWFSSTMALVCFISMWFANEGEAFHPHAVDVDHRHKLFLVVRSQTQCKLDCTVKNISTYVAPRGSSSSKQFTVLVVMISVHYVFSLILTPVRNHTATSCSVPTLI